MVVTLPVFTCVYVPKHLGKYVALRHWGNSTVALHTLLGRLSSSGNFSIQQAERSRSAARQGVKSANWISTRSPNHNYLFTLCDLLEPHETIIFILLLSTTAAGGSCTHPSHSSRPRIENGVFATPGSGSGYRLLGLCSPFFCKCSHSYSVRENLPLIFDEFVSIPIRDLLLHPLKHYPGPFIARFTNGYGAYYALRRSLHLKTYEDHRKYGGWSRYLLIGRSND
jgi:hypothetical protein